MLPHTAWARLMCVEHGRPRDFASIGGTVHLTTPPTPPQALCVPAQSQPCRVPVDAVGSAAEPPGGGVQWLGPIGEDPGTTQTAPEGVSTRL